MYDSTLAKLRVETQNEDDFNEIRKLLLNKLFDAAQYDTWTAQISSFHQLLEDANSTEQQIAESEQDLFDSDAIRMLDYAAILSVSQILATKDIKANSEEENTAKINFSQKAAILKRVLNLSMIKIGAEDYNNWKTKLKSSSDKALQDSNNQSRWALRFLNQVLKIPPPSDGAKVNLPTFLSKIVTFMLALLYDENTSKDLEHHKHLSPKLYKAVIDDLNVNNSAPTIDTTILSPTSPTKRVTSPTISSSQRERQAYNSTTVSQPSVTNIPFQSTLRNDQVSGRPNTRSAAASAKSNTSRSVAVSQNAYSAQTNLIQEAIPIQVQAKQPAPKAQAGSATTESTNEDARSPTDQLQSIDDAQSSTQSQTLQQSDEQDDPETEEIVPLGPVISDVPQTVVLDPQNSNTLDVENFDLTEALPQSTTALQRIANFGNRAIRYVRGANNAQIDDDDEKNQDAAPLPNQQHSRANSLAERASMTLTKSSSTRFKIQVITAMLLAENNA